MLRDYIILARPQQYVKNLFILLPLFFGGKFFELELLGRTLLVALSFSLLASAAYILNDYHDVAEDRLHPTKKNRPLASGRVTPGRAFLPAAAFLLAGLALAAGLGNAILLLLSSYILLNVAYTMKLKHVAILDVFIIAVGFVLRLYAGSAASGVGLSMWIVLMTFLLALFLALAKRRNDVLIYLETERKTRKAIDGYTLEFLNASIVIMASVTIVAYIMYTVSGEAASRIQSEYLYFTVGFVLLGIMRYMQVSFLGKEKCDPTEVLLKDRFLQLSILAWIVSFGLILYN